MENNSNIKQETIETLYRFMNEKNIDEFISIFSKINEEDFSHINPNILLYAGICYVNKLNYNKTYNIFRKMFNLDKRYALCYADFVLNNYQNYNGEYEVLIDELKETLHIIPAGRHRAHLFQYIALAYDLLDNQDASIEYYMRAYADDQENMGLYFSKIKNCLNNKKSKTSSIDSIFNDSGVSVKSINTIAFTRSIGGDRVKWHTGDTADFYPTDIDKNLPFQDAVAMATQRSLPKRPVFQRDSKVLTIGSCFAQNIRKRLQQTGRLAAVADMPDGMNSTLAVRSYLNWCYTANDDNLTEAYFRNKEKINKFIFSGDNETAKNVLEYSDGIIITYGVSSVWKDVTTGKYFWHGVPAHEFVEGRHVSVQTDTAWNVNNIKETIALIRRHKPAAPVILTLSPVPLAATFSEKSIWEADCASKSVLRAAIEEVLAEKPGDVYYWPSFEIIRWIGAHLNYSFYSHVGDEETKGHADNRHVRDKTVHYIVDAFIKGYFAD